MFYTTCMARAQMIVAVYAYMLFVCSAVCYVNHGLPSRRMFQVLDTGIPIGPFKASSAKLSTLSTRLQGYHSLVYGRDNVKKVLHLQRRMMAEALHSTGWDTDQCACHETVGCIQLTCDVHMQHPQRVATAGWWLAAQFCNGRRLRYRGSPRCSLCGGGVPWADILLSRAKNRQASGQCREADAGDRLARP